MPTLTIVAEIKAKPGKEAELQKLLESLVAPSRKDKGCLDYVLHVSNEDPGFFLFYESWASKEEWEQHMATPHLEDFKAHADELVADLTIRQMTRIEMGTP